MSGLQILVQTTGWDPKTQQDGPLTFDGRRDLIAISIMLPVSPTEGKWFTANFMYPELLWQALQELDRDRDSALKKYFDYSPPEYPSKPRRDLSQVSVDDLLGQLRSL